MPENCAVNPRSTRPSSPHLTDADPSCRISTPCAPITRAPKVEVSWEQVESGVSAMCASVGVHRKLWQPHEARIPVAMPDALGKQNPISAVWSEGMGYYSLWACTCSRACTERAWHAQQSQQCQHWNLVSPRGKRHRVEDNAIQSNRDSGLKSLTPLTGCSEPLRPRSRLQGFLIGGIASRLE